MQEASAQSRPTATMGSVVAVRGSVVDVAFPGGSLPAVNEALEVDWDGPNRLVLEVQQHRDVQTVRAVAMQNTSGLRRHTPVRALGGPITVPIGDPVLGRCA